MKNKIIAIYDSTFKKHNILKDLPLFAMRVLLAKGFWTPGMMKFNDIDSIGEWFGSMNIPFPLANAYMAASTEVVGAILLLVGFGSRLISIPLMIVMMVAIFTVHFANGYEAGSNGYEIPLYYLVMLFTITIYGSGRISLDSIIRKFITK